MSKTRTELHDKLLTLTKNVYFQPPRNTQMRYPAIVYSMKNIQKNSANNAVYLSHRVYQVIVIDYDPDCKIVDELIEWPYCSFDRHYVSNNLNHFVFTLFY